MGLLDGKVAIVTGGGRGLGRAHCLALSAAGATVVVNDLGAGLHGESTAESPAQEVAAEITAAGGRAVADHCSVSDFSATEALVERTVKEFGRLDVVVNNAGIIRDKMIASMDESDFDAVIAVHLKGTFSLTRHAAAYWRAASKRGERVAGRIINTTSGTGLFGTVGQANYGAAKAGIVSLTTIAAMELRRYGVTVNAISPLAATRMTAGIALGQKGEGAAFDPRDPANASGVVVYLASDEAAWLTGQVFRVDGHRVQRLQGWTPIAEYAGSGDGPVTGEELVDGLPKIYGTLPAGPPRSS
ncbi:putative enzyme [Frankia canadensis]|uniref:Putative enzyme n=1 Tax=Frankia canadensis TaxID=1836972 RepID=A0A2I2KNT1_9ACTN|nr:SDR family NAD(P)-dependent oxidoreductase [Frankia canadensis]SNQ47302.1 putative enzyme [Frankia canadensis]SOU54592.1 putative enzyme [Frankia canadensis]